MGNKRINAISYVRVVSMLLIVTAHCMCYYHINSSWPFHTTGNVAYTEICDLLTFFGVSSFVIISGFLYQHSRISHNKAKQWIIGLIVKKSKRLLVPYLFWGIVQFFLFPTFTLGTLITGNLHLWFLLMLFNVTVLYGIIDNIILTNENLWTAWVGGVILLVISFAIYPLFIKYISSGTNILCINNSMAYFPLFVGGALSCKYLKRYPKLLLQLANSFCWIFSLLLMLVLYFFSRMGKHEYVFLLGSRIMLLFFILLLITRYRDCNINRNVVKLDIWSMGVYIVHHIIIWILLSNTIVSSFMDEHVILGPLMMIMIVFSSSLWITSVLLSNEFFKKTIGG